MSEQLVPQHKNLASLWAKRRWVIFAGVGVAVAVAVLVSQSADAADGQPVLLGTTNYATVSTQIRSTSNTAIQGILIDEPSEFSTAVQGSNSGGGRGVTGTSVASHGVYGQSSSNAGAGVYGLGNAAAGTGVWGTTPGADGYGVLAENTGGGVALKTVGKLRFLNASGHITIASGQTSTTFAFAGVNRSSMVVATVQRGGGFFASAIPDQGQLTIKLNKAPVAPQKVPVAFLVMN